MHSFLPSTSRDISVQKDFKTSLWASLWVPHWCQKWDGDNIGGDRRPHPPTGIRPVERNPRQRRQSANSLPDGASAMRGNNDGNGSAGGYPTSEHAEAPGLLRGGAAWRPPPPSMSHRPSSKLVARGDGRPHHALPWRGRRPKSSGTFCPTDKAIVVRSKVCCTTTSDNACHERTPVRS